MSRKSKPRPQPTPSLASPVALAPRDEQAGAALAAARFKDAIEQYKALLKGERRPEWVAALADAYAGRAEQLAAKDMLKEAIALWRTRAEACATPLLGGQYVRWLLRAGQADQVFRLLGELPSLAPAARDRVEAELTAAALAAPEAMLGHLPADMPLVRHLAAARTALAAATSGDEAALDEALKAIAFRSPYRDLRPLLRALALRHSDPQQAAALLDRIDTGGPLERLAAALRVAVLPPQRWLAGLRALDDAARALVLELAGCPESQRTLVTELVQADDAPATFDAIARHRQAMPAGEARALCLRLLPHAPHRLNTFQSAFGPLSYVDRDRQLALAAEVRRDYEEAESYWSRVVEHWRRQPATSRRAAMVLRHLANDRHFGAGDNEDSDTALALDRLAQSLALDPADRESELRLLRGLRARGDLKAARKRLDSALDRFAADTAVLLEAVQTALAGGAFKKAIALAKQVLAIDPINPQVRSLIGQAHLAHARKQISARHMKAAVREVDEARTWLRAAADRGLAGVLRALAAEVVAEGEALLHQALADLGGTPLAMFRVALEAIRVGFDAATVLRRAGADLNVVPEPAELVALAQALNALPANDRGIRRALEPLEPMLLNAAKRIQGSEAELALICEALHRYRFPGPLRRIAAQALKRWPGQPQFVYFDLVARYENEPWRMPQDDFERLEDALQRAQAQGDRRSVDRIVDLLTQSSGPGFGAYGDEAPSDLDATTALEALEAIVAFGGEREFMDLARRELGKPAFDELRRGCGGDDKQFVQMLLRLLSPGLPAPPAGARPAPSPRPRAADDRQPGLFDD